MGRKRPELRKGFIVGALAFILAAIVFTISQLPGNVQEEQNSSYSVAEETGAYHFRSEKLLQEHFQKHGSDFEYGSEKEYEAGASAVIKSPDAMNKKEKEDGDDVFFIEKTGEFVILSTDGYIRTYFKPEDGIRYYNKQ